MLRVCCSKFCFDFLSRICHQRRKLDRFEGENGGLRITNTRLKQRRREESSEEEDTPLVAGGDLGQNQDNVNEGENRTEMSAELETPKSRRDPASIRKLAMPNEDSSSSETSEDDSDSEEVGPTGFRLINVSILVEMIELLRCPYCKSSVKLDEEKKQKWDLLLHSKSVVPVSVDFRSSSTFQPE